MAKLPWIDNSANIWLDRARELNLRIRDRFRVAVDCHHRRWETQSLDCSTSVRRCINRLQSLLKDPSNAAAPQSLSSSFKFYRKKVGKDVTADDSVVARMLQALAVPILGTACHAFMHGLNDVRIYGAEKLHQALLQRPQGIPLLTVSNHVASVDDPLVIASLLPPSVIANAQKLRWTLCASDRCFTNPAFSAFFRCVKVLPVSRGEGIYQKGMDVALSKLNNGGWVHIFPEGSRSRDGGRTMSNAKRGVGRLVIDADTVPIVVPFVHTGMQEIMPIGSHLPKVGKTVTVLIGDPILFDDLLINKDDPDLISSGNLYDEISSRIGHRLQELKVRVDQLAMEQVSRAQEHSHKENGCGIWQQVDWEAFGMDSYMPGEQIQTVRQLSNNQQGQNLFDQANKPIPRGTISLSFSYESGIISRIRGYMDPSELMGFAARGLFTKGQLLEETRHSIQDMSPLKNWKQFLEGNVHQWN